MSKLLDYEIIALKNELLALKSYKQKVAGQLKIKEYIIPIEFTLGYDINQRLAGTQTAWLTITPQDVNVTGILVSWGIDIDDLDKRVIWNAGGIYGNTGTYVEEFYLQRTENTSDTVGKKIQYNISIVTTALVDIQLTYEDN